MQITEVRSRLLQRAQALGIAAATEEAMIDALLDRDVPIAPPTDAEVRAYYEREATRLFSAGALFEADHILFAVTEGVPLEALRERAQAVLDDLLQGPERFAALAAEFSNCPSGGVGGSLGQIGRADVVPEFWTALDASTGTGVLPRLVESRFGLHIVRIARRIPGRPVPFEAVRERIAAHLAEQRLRAALRDYAHALVHAETARH
jgi:peptidyl-prolyl cis-trans isomerase C